jgi:FlgD Ig-like domain
VVVVVFLLGGTAAAFAVTQGLKLEKSPVLSPRITKTFSPLCDCDRWAPLSGGEHALVNFKLRKADRVTLEIVDGDGDVVRTLFRGRRFGPVRLEAGWDGRDDTGRVVPDGDYRPRVRLAEAHRTIVFPNEIAVDTEKPRIERFSVSRRVFSPDGDGRADGVSVSYRLSERGRVRLFVNGKQRVRKLGQAPTGAIQWFGKFRGRAVKPRPYRLELVAVDDAGNRSQRVFAGSVRVRYAELGVNTIRARAGTRFGVRVRTDARRYAWLFAGGRGSSTARYLVLRAPRKPGRYRLFVQVRGRGDSAAVVVTPAR